MAEPAVSVLMAVYMGTPAAQLSSSLDSVVAQTRPADEIVIVEDGPLTPAHLRVLDDLESRHPRVRRLHLPVNRGQGVANQVGLEAATGTWIAKADADDISLPHRFEVQLKSLGDAGADVCGTAILEFEEDPSVVVARRNVPLRHEQIAQRMRLNNPINHPSAVFRRDLALASGGYPDLRFGEDYVLFARMLAAGARFMNLSEPLVYFRADAAMHSRRALRGQLGAEWRLQRELRRTGTVGSLRSGVNLVVRLVYRALPTRLRVRVHRQWLGRRAQARSTGARPQ